MMNQLLFILLLSVHSFIGNLASLNCTPQGYYVCDGHEVVCNCTTTCDNFLQWWDNNTVTFSSRTQYCDDMVPQCIDDVCTEVIARNNCDSSSSSGTFTSRLNFTANAEMERIQIGCYIEATNTSMLPTSESRSPMREQSSELNSVTMWRVTNCTDLTPTPTPTVQLSSTSVLTSTPTPTFPSTSVLTSTPTPTAPHTDNGGINAGAVAGAVVGGIVLIIFTVAVLVYCCIKKGACKKSSNGTSGTEEHKMKKIK